MEGSSSGPKNLGVKKKRAQSRPKGNAFERRIAQDMRQIYDSSELLEKLAAAAKLKGKGATSAHRTLLKESRVRRSDQGRGALEPDLVIQGCPLWLELRDGREPMHYAKLAQAERDVEQTGSSLRPVAVVHRTGAKDIQAWMRAETLLYLLGFDDLTDSAGCVIPLSDAPGASVIVMIDYEELLERLRFRRDVALEESENEA
jgi:hypothetical protein